MPDIQSALTKQGALADGADTMSKRPCFVFAMTDRRRAY